MEEHDLGWRFAYHRLDEAKAELHGNVRIKCQELAEFIANEIPVGREQSLALTKIEEAMFWANAGIARN